MGLLILIQVFFDLAFIALITLLLIERSKLRNMEDPRISRGLQLVSAKMAVLQDLMERSESMGRQLSQLIDKKRQSVQETVEEIEGHLHRVRQATEKSEQVAKIFQDRIPHQEIIERQNTAKYISAAKLAHQGLSIDEISRQTDIPRGELELIVKLNRDRLLVGEGPEWIENKPTEQIQSADESGFETLETSTAPLGVLAVADQLNSGRHAAQQAQSLGTNQGLSVGLFDNQAAGLAAAVAKAQGLGASAMTFEGLHSRTNTEAGSLNVAGEAPVNSETTHEQATASNVAPSSVNSELAPPTPLPQGTAAPVPSTDFIMDSDIVRHSEVLGQRYTASNGDGVVIKSGTQRKITPVVFRRISGRQTLLP